MKIQIFRNQTTDFSSFSNFKNIAQRTAFAKAGLEFLPPVANAY